MARSKSTPPQPPQQEPQRASAPTLLADLESRQEELIRLLDDLEERTKQALARLSICDPAANAATTGAQATAPKKVA